MKILILHWGTRGGGPQLQAQIGRALIEDPSVEILLSFDRASESSEDLGRFATPALRVGVTHGRGRARLILRCLAQPLDAVKLMIFCIRHRVDVVYEVMDHPFQLIPKLLLRLTRTQVLGSIHDATRHPGEESRLLETLTKISVRACDGLMTYSAAVAKAVRHESPVPAERVFQTVHGAFGEVSNPRSHPGKTKEFTIGFFGRVERYKGLARLLAAVQRLQHLGYRVHAQIDGRGTTDLREQSLMSAVGATHNAGWVDEEHIQNVIEGYDILALPYDEASQSGVLGFAMSSGTPCVATPVGGLGEQVTESGVGLVAQTMSVESYADALRSLIDNPQSYNELSERGIESARGQFSWARVANDVKSAASTLVVSSQRRKGVLRR